MPELQGPLYLRYWGPDFEALTPEPERVAEMCDSYEALELDLWGRFLLMDLIICSYDDYLRLHKRPDRDADLDAHLENLLERDFALHQHIIDYWRDADVTDDEED